MTSSMQMKQVPQSWFYWSRKSVLSNASGEGFARLCNLVLIAFVSRRFGVRALGAFALAQGLSLYLSQAMDLGLRHVGARLVAVQPDRAWPVVIAIQKKRFLLAIPVVALGYCYGRFGPVPEDTRTMVSFYALSMVGYALSLDWVAWGMKQFAWMSGWRAIVSLTGLGITTLCAGIFHAGLSAIPIGNGVAYIVAAYLLWNLWAKRVLNHESLPGIPDSSHPIIPWRSVLGLGVTMLANQAFSSVDMLILGSLSTSHEVGLYSAAYRLLLLVFAVYYLIMQAIYPQLATVPHDKRVIATLQPYLWRLAWIGLGVMLFMEAIRKPLIAVLYGSAFDPAARLSTPILYAIPIELLASFLFTAMIAWDRTRGALFATIIGCISNVALNVYLIPRYGAMGAAYAVPISYGVFLLILLVHLFELGGTQRAAAFLSRTWFGIQTGCQRLFP
jgi:O-antigen/teichoic acid export membrane protein